MKGESKRREFRSYHPKNERGRGGGWRDDAYVRFRMSRLILASGSPRRVQLLREARFDPDVVVPEVAELSCDFLTPSELTRYNARLKAVTVAIQFPDSVVLGADTVVALGLEVFGKPRDLDDAARMLGQLVGKTHLVITGVALIDANTGRMVLQSVSSTVTFRALSRGEIDDYLKIVDPLDKAGAYAAQESANVLIERIDGSFTNVVGLPMELVRPLLRSVGVRPSSRVDQRSSR
jgi:septum formation protein